MTPASVSRSATWALWALLSVGVALFSYRYVAAIGPLPEKITSNGAGFIILALHAGFASTALLIGPFQFVTALRQRFPRLHRLMGRVYVVMCVLGGLTGLPLALGATAGPIASAGFGLLALGWLWTTTRAWQLAVARKVNQHREWMIRSFALTSAGVMLRIYLGLLLLLPLDFTDGYRAIAFLCWVPNIVLAELYIRWRRRGPALRPMAA